ncbi:MAG TPA: neuraminidase-like domain-containing protein [Candidatus Acidoferrales bacterium]|jgi:hypothetical protein|nr:neuraminidase-like domain-containing protein [Candidatus Acidoferrales bacterium]
MDHAPWFDRPDLFDGRRIRLADIDGSGTADIIYFASGAVDLYFNQSGNAWGAKRSLSHFPSVESVSSATALDLLGNGTACLAWSSPLPGNARRAMRYIDLMGGQKPHLLVRVTNNLGAETVVQYAPSTRFYVADKLAGKPWVTRLPFPVHVVERVQTYDYISRNLFVTLYAYHHGYYDGVEREFRGFGRVDQWDAEEFATLTSSTDFPQPTNVAAASNVPPVCTKTWFHTGAFFGETKVSKYFAHEYYTEGDSSDAIRGLKSEQLEAMLLDDTVLPTTILLPSDTLPEGTNHLGDEDTVVPSTYSEVFRNAAVLASASPVFVPLNQSTIIAASNPGLIAITTAAPHGYQTGMRVSISGVLGNAVANGTSTITVTSPTSFTLNGSSGNGDWTSGGIATGVLSGNKIIPDPSPTPPPTPTPEQNAIAASLGLSADDISAILAFTGAANALSLDTLNVLLRYQRLSSSLSLGISDLILWIELTGRKPFPGSPADTLEFCRRLAVLQGTGLAIHDLDYLIRGQSETQSSLAFTTARATAVLQAIRDAVAKLPGATSIPIPAYDATTIQTIFVTALAAATGTRANVVTPVLLKTGVLPLDSNTVALLVAQNSPVDPLQFPAIVNAFTSVAKAAALFTALKPTETEFAFVVQNAGTFIWLDPSALPLAPTNVSPYSQFEALLRALRLNKRQTARTPKLFDILGLWLPPNSLPDVGPTIDALALALNASVNDVIAIAQALGATKPGLTLGTLPGSLADMAMLTSIASALDVVARYGISGMALVQLATVPANPETASAARGALQAQYAQSAWFGAIQPVEDVLRQNRRDALVAYLLSDALDDSRPALLTTDDIFNYYLIDPEMCPCALMTRLLQASLAIQQFMQQCFLNLSFANVSVDMSNADLVKEWEWRQQYRLWQANREVFLYPENYLLPELRTNASPFFSDLENELRQSNCDGDAVETALENYLRKLVGVANLQVAAHCNQTNPDGSTVLHVFARTSATPPQWYYRARTGKTPDSGSWSAWEPLNLDIASQHLIPVVWDRRLHLIWPVFKQISEKQSDQQVSSSSGGGTKSPPQKFWAVEFAMSELSAGQCRPNE